MGSAGKTVTGGKSDKTCDWWKAREKIKLLENVGTRKTRDRLKARENDDKRGKYSNWWKAREKMQVPESVGTSKRAREKQ